MSSTATKIRPAKRLIETSAKCSQQGITYGNCVLNNYATMSKDKCGQEFNEFKNCISRQLKGKKW